VPARTLSRRAVIFQHEFVAMCESAIGSAPRRRESSVEEGSTWIIVDKSGLPTFWQVRFFDPPRDFAHACLAMRREGSCASLVEYRAARV